MVGVQLMAMLLQHLLNVGNHIIDVMVIIHRPTTRPVFIGISMTELVYIGSKVDIWWDIRLFRFIVPLESVDTTDLFHDTLGFPIKYHKNFNMNQDIFPVSLPYG